MNKLSILSIIYGMVWIQLLVAVAMSISIDRQLPNLSMSSEGGNTGTIPQSIKLSFTGVDGEMRVTWFTTQQPESPSVQFSTLPFEPSQGTGKGIEGGSTTYQPAEKWTGYINTAVINGLQSSTHYYYSCGDKQNGVWSQLLNFTTGVYPSNRQSTVSPFSIVTYGDMGDGGGDSNTITNIMNRIYSLSFILHVGDIAYADEDSDKGDQSIWDSFLQQINSITSQVPYMVCIGNHDVFQNEQVYLKTFNMPSPKKSDTWYSFDYNGVHFIGFSTEDEFESYSDQYTWIENDLSTYRSQNPDGWVIAFAHRPMYCSSTFDWCQDDKKKKTLVDNIEPLFYKYNVDLYITGHSHSYERSLPVYQDEIMGDYNSPKAPVHVVVGIPGNVEGLVNGWDDAPSWSSGPRIESDGFAVLNIINSTVLEFQLILNDNPNQVADQFYLSKGSF